MHHTEKQTPPQSVSLNEMAERAARQVSDATEQAVRQVSQATSNFNLSQQVSDYPWLTMGLSVLAGYALGAMRGSDSSSYPSYRGSRPLSSFGQSRSSSSVSGWFGGNEQREREPRHPSTSSSWFGRSEQSDWEKSPWRAGGEKARRPFDRLEHSNELQHEDAVPVSSNPQAGDQLRQVWGVDNPHMESTMPSMSRNTNEMRNPQASMSRNANEMRDRQMAINSQRMPFDQPLQRGRGPQSNQWLGGEWETMISAAGASLLSVLRDTMRQNLPLLHREYEHIREERKRGSQQDQHLAQYPEGAEQQPEHTPSRFEPSPETTGEQGNLTRSTAANQQPPTATGNYDFIPTQEWDPNKTNIGGGG